MPLWLEYLLKGIFIFASLSAAAVVAGRAGRSPYLALLLLAPFVNIVVIWLFAFSLGSQQKN